MLYCRVCGKPTDRYLNKETICLLEELKVLSLELEIPFLLQWGE